MKYHIVTYGCQMNKSDSERIAMVLELAGLSPASDMAGADLLIINSCSVRQSAINRIFGLLNNLKKARRKNKIQGIKTILTGCVLDADKKKLADKFDLIIDIKELTQKPKNLIDFLRLENQEFKAFDYTDYFKINPQYRSKFSAYVPIMTGCNNFCAYCAVPYTRGREISRPAQEIIAEIKKLIEKGYKEITLLGQNVNSYASTISNDKYQITNQCQNPNDKKKSIHKIPNTKYPTRQINFPQLLTIINNIPGDFWIRFLTSHPKDMSDKLIKTMVKCEKVTEYVHLPIQSGDDEILNKMNRHYTQEHYLELIDKIKSAYAVVGTGRDLSLPVAISTDIIVGFPGETKKQFASTAKLMRRVKFDMAYLSEYSPRTGTAAAKLKDSVTVAEKKRRKECLNEVLRKTALANNKQCVGKTVDVLIEKIDADFAYGKTQTFKNVKVPLTVTARNDRRERQSHASGRSAEGGQSRVKRDKVRDCRALRLLDGELAMTILQPGQFARIKITKATPWNLEGKISE